MVAALAALIIPPPVGLALPAQTVVLALVDPIAACIVLAGALALCGALLLLASTPPVRRPRMPRPSPRRGPSTLAPQQG